MVCDNARVYGTKVHGNAVVGGWVHADLGAEITDNAVVCGDSFLEMGAYVYGNVRACGRGGVPMNVGVGDDTVIYNSDNSSCYYGNETLKQLSNNAWRIKYLRDIVNYWFFAGLSPYGSGKSEPDSFLEFRKAVEGFIFNGGYVFENAISIHYCKDQDIDPSEWLDCEEYDLSSVSIPARLSHCPEGWKGRKSANPVISKEDALSEVRRNGLLLRWVEEQTPELCLAAVKQNGYALQWVKEQTLGLCAAALLENFGARGYAEWLPEYEKSECDENGYISIDKTMAAMEESLRAGRMVKVCC